MGESATTGRPGSILSEDSANGAAPVARSKARRKRKRGRPPKSSLHEEGARESLVAAALGLFATRGFDGVSLAQIAEVAGTTPSLVHYYFESKTDLWRTALGSVLGELRQEFDALEKELEDLDCVAALEEVIRRFITFSSRHPELSLILRNERGSEGPRMEWLWNEQWMPLRSLPLKLIEAAQEQGRLRPAASAHVLAVLVGACLQPLRGRQSLAEIYGLEPSSPEAIDIHADLVVDTLLHGLVRSP